MEEVAGRKTGGLNRGERRLGDGFVQDQHGDANDERGVLEQRLGWGARQNRDVRMLAVTMLLGDHAMAGRMILGAVLRRMMMRQAVAHLGGEESQSCQQRQDNPNRWPRARVPHRHKITGCPRSEWERRRGRKTSALGRSAERDGNRDHLGTGWSQGITMSTQSTRRNPLAPQR